MLVPSDMQFSQRLLNQCEEVPGKNRTKCRKRISMRNEKYECFVMTSLVTKNVWDI